MAATTLVKRSASGEPIIDALTNGAFWVLDDTRTITWAVADAPGADWKWSPSSAGVMRDSLASILSKYAEVANVRFQYEGWFADFRTAPANVVLGATKFPESFDASGAYAWAYFPFEPGTDAQIAQLLGSSAAYPDASGDVQLNFTNAEMLGTNYAPGSIGYFAIMHEMGHALGLKHPHDDGGTVGRPTFAQLGFTAADTQILTIMSYNPATTLAAWLQNFGLPANAGYPQTLMPLDVVALQNIYGPNTTTRAGDTVYELYNDDAVETYWDAGGQDVLTASKSSFGWSILSVSSLNDENLVVAVPRASNSSTGKFYFNVEHLEGSQFNDQILGTDSPNILFGLAGNDILSGAGGNDAIDGGPGLDVAVYNGNRSEHVVRVASSSWAVEDRIPRNGADTITSVERLNFTDRNVALDVHPGGAASNAALAIRALFGPAALRVPEFVGAAIYVLDTGVSFQGLVDLAISIPNFDQSAGGSSNDAFVRFVYKNVVGVDPSGSELAYYSGLLASGAYNKGQLGALAALADVNVYSVEMSGVINGGLDYVTYPG